VGNVVKAGMEVVGEVKEGKSAKEVIKERGLSGIKRTVGDIMRQSPFNVGNAATTQPPAAKRAIEFRLRFNVPLNTL